MMEKLREKVKESLSSVLPITVIVLLLSILLIPMEVGAFSLFLAGAVFLIFGMGFFQLGADISMTQLGQGIGGQLIKKRNLLFIVGGCFLMGVLITISEPDLQVLANQVASIPNRVLVLTVAVGVGIFLVVAVLRILFKISLSRLLTLMYLLLFWVALAAPGEFLAVAFDSGGVTTGPMTVPFIMALGIGLSAARSDKDSANDSFGLIALSSIGPILMVLLLGIFYHPTDAVYTAVTIPDVTTTRDVINQFLWALPQYTGKQLFRMCIGFVYTIIGLIMFLVGVNVGFAPVGNLLGEQMVSSSYQWLLIPVGILIGYYIVKAEPAVQLLNHQVEDITDGMVTRGQMNICLSIGVAGAVGLAMIRVLTGIPVYWILIPGYILAIGMSYRVQPIIVGIAFDSGGVASGPMTSTFLLPLTMGACTALGGNVVTDAFGVVALVALAPLIAIQIMGLVYEHKLKKTSRTQEHILEDTIIELEDEEV